MKNLTLLTLIVSCLLSACSQADSSANQPVAKTAPPAVVAPVAPPRVQVGPLPTAPVDLSALAGLSVEQITQRHAQALSAGRLFSPAGDNVVEYELALRHLLGVDGQKSYQPLLNDAAPNLMFLAENAIAQGNLAERDRLADLMEAIDPTLPSVPRLRQSGTGQVSPQELGQVGAPAPDESIGTEEAPVLE